MYPSPEAVAFITIAYHNNAMKCAEQYPFNTMTDEDRAITTPVQTRLSPWGFGRQELPPVSFPLSASEFPLSASEDYTAAQQCTLESVNDKLSHKRHFKHHWHRTCDHREVLGSRTRLSEEVHNVSTRRKNNSSVSLWQRHCYCGTFPTPMIIKLFDGSTAINFQSQGQRSRSRSDVTKNLFTTTHTKVHQFLICSFSPAELTV